MNISLDLKGLSINDAYRGRRYDSRDKKQYDMKLRLMLPNEKMLGPYYSIHYKFFLINFSRTDQSNLIKCLCDGIVKRGIIRDDRYVVRELIEKFPSERDRMEIVIQNIDRPMSV